MKNAAFRRLAALALTLILCIVPLCAAPSVPDPTASFYVGDFADVLSDEVEQYIIEKNQALASSTGAQIVVVTVDFLDGYDIDDYAVTLFNDWGIGSSEYNNGYLILLAIADENYYSVPGKGIEDVFDGGTIDDLQWNYLEEGFAEGDYDKGVRAYFDAVLDAMEEQYGSSSAPVSPGQQPSVSPPDGGYYETGGSRGLGLTGTFFLIIMGIIVLAVVISLAGMRTIYIGGAPYRRRWLFWGPMIPRRPRPPRPPRPRYPPRGGGFGGPGRPGGGSFGSFGGGGMSRGGGAGRRSGGFGGSRGGSFGGSRGGSFGGSRGGGGMSRGGGAGRRGR